MYDVMPFYTWLAFTTAAIVFLAISAGMIFYQVGKATLSSVIILATLMLMSLFPGINAVIAVVAALVLIISILSAADDIVVWRKRDPYR